MVQDLLPSIDNKIVLWLVMLLGCVAIPCLLFWLVFPILLWLEVRKLSKLVGQLSESPRSVLVEPAPAEATPAPAAEPAVADQVVERGVAGK